MAGFWQWCKHGGRFCGHSLQWFLQAALLGLAGVQLAVLLALLKVEEVTAPAWVAERLNRELAAYGWEARWERLGFDFRGYLHVAGLTVHDLRLGEDLLEASAVRLNVDFSSLLGGRLELDGFRLEGGRVFAPAMMAPGGARALLADKVLLSGGRRANRWHLDHAQGQVGGMTLRAAGVVPVAPPAERGPPPPPAAVRRQVLAGLGTAAEWVPQLGQAGAWRWQVTAAPDGSEQVRLAVSGWLDRWEGYGVEVIEVTARVPDLVPLLGLVPQGVEVGWRSLTGPEGFTTGRGSARVALGPLAVGWPVRRVEVHVHDLQHPWVTVPTLAGDLVLAGWPEVRGRAQATVDGRLVRVSGRLDTETWSGEVSADSELDLGAWLARAPLPFDVERYFRLGGPPRLWVNAILGPGGRPVLVTARGDLPHGGAIMGWQIDRMSGRATWDGRRLVAEELVVENPGYRATGSYEEDLVTRGYRLRATGTIRPDDLNPLFGQWWDGLWPQFGFGPAPEIDLSVAGWWNGSHERYIWGRVEAENISFRTVPMDHLSARLRVEENYVDIYELEGRGPAGRLGGQLQFLLFPDQARTFSTLLQVDAVATLGALGSVAGPVVARILEDFNATGRPQVALRGWFHEGGGDAWRNLHVEAQTAEPIRYRNMDLEWLNLTLDDDGDRLTLAPVSAGFAGGTGAGQGTFTGLGTPDPQLELSLSLQESAYADTLDLLRGLQPIVPEAEVAEAPLVVATPTDPVPPALDPRTGTISLNFAGSGRADDTNSFTGQGDFVVKGANFAYVQVLGALSRLFEGSPIGFSTVRLADAAGNFVLGPGEIDFPDLSLTGPLSRAEARGVMDRRGGALDFRVRVFLLDESSNIFSGLLQPVFRPLGRMMELRLRGTLDTPEWNLLFDPRNLFGGGSPPPTTVPPLPTPAPVPLAPETPPDVP